MSKCVCTADCCLPLQNSASWSNAETHEFQMIRRRGGRSSSSGNEWIIQHVHCVCRRCRVCVIWGWHRRRTEVSIPWRQFLTSIDIGDMTRLCLVCCVLARVPKCLTLLTDCAVCVAASTRNEIVTFFPSYLWDTGSIDDREISSNSLTEPVSWWKIPLGCGVFSLIRDSECFKLFFYSSSSRSISFSLHHNQSAISINFPANVVNTTRLCVSFSCESEGGKVQKVRSRGVGSREQFSNFMFHPIDTDIIMRLGRSETWNFSHLNSMLLLDTAECFCFELSEWKV